MNFFIAIIIMLLIIIVSYLADRKYPTKRIYIIPTGIIFLCLVVAYTSWLTPTTNNKISEEQRLSILNEQPYFITWYNNHKEIISQLDRFCRLYHKTITAYENGIISTEETISRLQRLHDETDKFNQSLQDLLPPNELSQNNYILVYDILEKTRIYSYKINETVRQSIVILSQSDNLLTTKKEIINHLNRIYAVEGPIILNINSEVLQLKNNLTIPE